MPATKANKLAGEDYTLAKDNYDLGHLPGSNGWPIVGDLPKVLGDLLGLAQQRYQQYGPVSRVNMAINRGVLALGPELSQQILLDTKQDFSPKMGYRRSLKPFFGEGLLLQDFDEHRFQRRILQSGFKTPAMKGYVELMNPVLQQGINNWYHKKDFKFFPEIKSLLLKMALKVFYGVEEGEAESRRLSQAFLDCTEGQLGLFMLDLPGFKFHRGLNGRRYLREYIRKLIPTRREQAGQDMLSHMCKEKKEDGSYFSDEEILDHAGFLLFAAHDTTTSTLNHLIYYLAKHQDWQQTLRNDSLALNKPTLDYDDLAELQNLEYAFYESQRLHPSVSVMLRRTVREVELGGYKIPAHTQVFQIPAFNNRFEKYWPEPDKFDPLRFSPARAEHKAHPFAFMPFGGGAHKCIGMHFANMQTKLFTHLFLQRYQVDLLPQYQANFQMIPMPKLRDDLPLTLTLRG